MIDLHDSSKTLDEFRAKLKESGSDFPESFITSMDRLVLSMHPKYKKKKAATTNGADKGKGKEVDDGPVESEDMIKQRKLFPGLAIKDSEWQPSYAPDSEAGKIKGAPEVEDFLDDMMSQLEGAEKRIKGSGTADLKRKRSISPPVVRGRRQSPDCNSRRNDEERGRGGRARQPLDTQPVMYKIYPGKVTGIKDFGAFVSLEGIQGRHEGMVHISAIQSNARVNHPSDLLSRGQSVMVKVMSIAAGRIGLSMKDVDQDSGRDLTPHLRIKSEAEMAEETASRFSSGSNSGPLGGRGFGNAAPVKFADDNRSSAKRLTSPERWEIKQLIASGAASASDYPNLDEDFATPNATEADEELDIEVKEDEAPFLAGQARRALDMSPVKIIKSLDGSLNRAAMAGASLAKERREMRQQELNDQADSEDKDLGTAWQDPMAAPMERQFAADLRGQQMSRKKADDGQPTWRGDKNQPVTFGKITNQTMAEQRASLPIYQYRQQLVEAIRDVSAPVSGCYTKLTWRVEPSHGSGR